MLRKTVYRWVCVLLLAAFGGGCAGDAAANPEAAADAIEAYLQARVDSNLDQMTLLSCPAWEAQARIEATSFEAMNATLDGVVCVPGGADGDATLVNCEGKIVTTYQGEVREWSVSEHPYKAVLDGGEWRMCGYGE